MKSYAKMCLDRGRDKNPDEEVDEGCVVQLECREGPSKKSLSWQPTTNHAGPVQNRKKEPHGTTSAAASHRLPPQRAGAAQPGVQHRDLYHYCETSLHQRPGESAGGEAGDAREGDDGVDGVLLVVHLHHMDLQPAVLVVFESKLENVIEKRICAKTGCRSSEMQLVLILCSVGCWNKPARKYWRKT